MPDDAVLAANDGNDPSNLLPIHEGLQPLAKRAQLARVDLLARGGRRQPERSKRQEYREDRLGEEVADHLALLPWVSGLDAGMIRSPSLKKTSPEGQNRTI